MKKLWAFPCIIMLAALWLSCGNQPSNTKDIQTINANDLEQGPIVHDSLSAGQMDKIKHIQQVFAEVYPVNLDETVTNFKRDQHPDREIAIWLAMAKAYEAFNKKHDWDPDKKQEVFTVLLMRSMYEGEELKANLKVDLSEKEIEEVLSYFKMEAKPLIYQ